MGDEQEEPRTQQRLRVILAHLGGQLNATQAAQELGVSRKTFYEWLERARQGMIQALRDRPTGRPPEPVDEEKERLLAERAALEQERAVLEGRLRIQAAIRQVQAQAAWPKKKPREP